MLSNIKAIARKVYFLFSKYRAKKKFTLKLGKKVFFDKTSIFEGSNYLSDYAQLLSSKIGYASYLGVNTVIRKANIGRYTSIGPDVKCIFGKHPAKVFVSTHPAFFSTRKQVGFSFTEKQLFKEFSEPLDIDKKYSIIIGNDVWIGAGAIISEGVKIGDGAIIASYSLVTKDVAPYSIVGGVPAKVIKYRFEQEQIDFLLNFKWWDKDFNWIKKNAQQFTNIEGFQNSFAVDEK